MHVYITITMLYINHSSYMYRNIVKQNGGYRINLTYISSSLVYTSL